MRRRHYSLSKTVSTHAAANIKCPHCGAEPMHPCQQPSGRARSLHVDRICEAESDLRVQFANLCLAAIESTACTECGSKPGEGCLTIDGRRNSSTHAVRIEAHEASLAKGASDVAVR